MLMWCNYMITMLFLSLYMVVHGDRAKTRLTNGGGGQAYSKCWKFYQPGGRGIPLGLEKFWSFYKDSKCKMVQDVYLFPLYLYSQNAEIFGFSLWGGGGKGYVLPEDTCLHCEAHSHMNFLWHNFGHKFSTSTNNLVNTHQYSQGSTTWIWACNNYTHLVRIALSSSFCDCIFWLFDNVT